jgi:exopolysaccharide biosynthesis protein
LQESGYRGYMAKVKLHDPSALKLVLANDQVKSRGETTSEAAKRTGAVLAINAGGFMRVGGGLIAPVGITVVDGEILTFSDDEKLSFVGFNKQGRLVGSTITSREQLEEMDVLHGASFLPTLLRDGKKQPIPKDWANRREPRTLIGHFSNGDLLFIVIDGRRKNWSSGVTLEEAQDKLLEFNVTDAYNLDGGGSSTFYYDGKVLNKPSDGSERRVTTNFVVLP